MAPIVQPNKRKAVTRDVPDSKDEISSSESGDWVLNGNFSDGDGDSDGEVGSNVSELDEEEGSEEQDEEIEHLDSDEIPSEGDEDDSSLKIVNGSKSRGDSNGPLRHGNLRVAGDETEDHDQSNYQITEDANGNPRYVYGEIDPVYDSDDSATPAITNTIGNIPLSFYDSYPHIGYDIYGKKISRPAKGEALDALLDSIEVPKGWTGLTDPSTGKPLELTKEELGILKRIHMNEVPEEGYDPYPDMIEYFSGKLEIMPLSAAPEPKRRFVPSKHEAKRVMKIVRAIREGRILPYKPPSEEE